MCVFLPPQVAAEQERIQSKIETGKVWGLPVKYGSTMIQVRNACRRRGYRVGRGHRIGRGHRSRGVTERGGVTSQHCITRHMESEGYRPVDGNSYTQR